MDSLSQLALGAAVGVAVMGRRTAVWKAAAWGAVAGTLPDLDVLIDHGGPVRNMVLHRGETHALFWLTIFSLPFAALAARVSGEWVQWRRWWLALWLALVTHPLLDAMTVYGTQLALPFSNYPYGVGSVFIIDPLYTLPLLVGVVWALKGRGNVRGARANLIGLALSTAYLAWGFGAQQLVSRIAISALTAQGLPADRVLITPTAFNSLLWRVVAMSDDAYFESYYSLLDPVSKRPTGAATQLTFERYARNPALATQLQDNESVQRLSAFTKSFYAMRQDGVEVLISDLRMGQEPHYTFTFAVARRPSPSAQKENQNKAGMPLENQQAALVPLTVPRMINERGDVACLLGWLRLRIVDAKVPPPVRFCDRSANSAELMR